jgi:hypothetical protein
MFKRFAQSIINMACGDGDNVAMMEVEDLGSQILASSNIAGMPTTQKRVYSRSLNSLSIANGRHGSRLGSGIRVAQHSDISNQVVPGSFESRVCTALRRACLPVDLAPIFKQLFPLSLSESALTEKLKGQARLDSIMTALSEIIDFVSRQSRLLVVLDDLHWLVSLGLLVFFCLFFFPLSPWSDAYLFFFFFFLSPQKIRTPPLQNG